jgi:hypothetical protein
LPRFKKMKAAVEVKILTHAAEMKQSCVPRPWTQGVTLRLCEFNDFLQICDRNGSNSPIADAERHGVTNKHNGCDGITAYIVVAVDHVVDRDGDTKCDSKCYEAECYDQCKPVDI